VATVGKGRAGKATVYIEGLSDLIKEAEKVDKRFSKEIRRASVEVANDLVKTSQSNARAVMHHGTGRSAMAVEAAKGLRAKSDRYPTIELRSGGFVSKSRSNRKRSVKVQRSDVFFGAEFGGQARRTTNQFNPYVPSPSGRGGRGYFFWPTVKQEAPAIGKRYLAAIDRVIQGFYR
jgi:hypothetical protein